MRVTYIDTTGNRQTYEVTPATAADRLYNCELEMCRHDASPDTVAEANGLRDAIADAVNYDRKQATRLIQRAFDALDVLNDITHTKHLREVYKEAKDEEKRSYSASDRLTTDQRAKLFVVWRLAQFATGAENPPSLADYLHTRKSIYTCAALAINYGAKIRAALVHARIDIHILARLDFAILNR